MRPRRAWFQDVRLAGVPGAVLAHEKHCLPAQRGASSRRCGDDAQREHPSFASAAGRYGYERLPSFVEAQTKEGKRASSTATTISPDHLIPLNTLLLLLLMPPFTRVT